MFAAWTYVFAGTTGTIDSRRMLPYVSSSLCIALAVAGTLGGDA
jgi:hypothetical protein